MSNPLRNILYVTSSDNRYLYNRCCFLLYDRIHPLHFYKKTLRHDIWYINFIADKYAFHCVDTPSSATLLIWIRGEIKYEQTIICYNFFSTVKCTIFISTWTNSYFSVFFIKIITVSWNPCKQCFQKVLWIELRKVYSDLQRINLILPYLFQSIWARGIHMWDCKCVKITD